MERVRPQTFDAVVFDMDGVLIDARDWHYEALNDALEIFGAHIPYDEHQLRFNGLPTREKLRILTQEGRLPFHVHDLVNDVKQERTLRQAAKLCFPDVSHLILLGTLKARGIRLGVATNSIRQTSSTMLAFAGVLPFLDVLITNEDVQRPKPSPEIYIRACEMLGVHPNMTLVIEDHDIGKASAEAAGCYCIQVSGPQDVRLDLVASVMDEIGDAPHGG